MYGQVAWFAVFQDDFSSAHTKKPKIKAPQKRGFTLHSVEEVEFVINLIHKSVGDYRAELAEIYEYRREELFIVAAYNVIGNVCVRAVDFSRKSLANSIFSLSVSLAMNESVGPW